MLRILRLLPFVILALGVGVPARGQSNPPSLGDVARQARKDKEKNSSTTAKVLTNDDVASGHGLGSLGTGLGVGSGEAGRQAAAPDPTASLDRAEMIIRKVATLDQPTLVTVALQGAAGDFPGRRAWEARLLAARQTYVSHGLDLLQQLRQTWAAAKALDASQPGISGSDPRAQALMSRIKALTQECVRTDAAFQAVWLEGRDLAKQTPNN